MLDASEFTLRKTYWLHVQACLTRFHRVTEQAATTLIDQYQTRFPLESEKPEVDLVYHFEPFRMACRLVGKRLSVKDHADEYRKILSTETPQPGGQSASNVVPISSVKHGTKSQTGGRTKVRKPPPKRQTLEMKTHGNAAVSKPITRKQKSTGKQADKTTASKQTSATKATTRKPKAAKPTTRKQGTRKVAGSKLRPAKKRERGKSQGN